MIKNQTVFIVYANAFSSLYGRFARYLRDEYGIQSVLIVRERSVLKTLSERDFHENDFFDIVEVGDCILARDIFDISIENLSAEVRTIEKKLSLPLTEIIRADRHLGKNFITGAEYPRSHYGVNTSFDQSIDIAVRLTKLFFELVNKYQPMALITVPGNIVSTAAIDVCKASNIPLMAPVIARAQNAICWAMNKAYTPYGLEELYNEELSNTSIESLEGKASSELERNDRITRALAISREKASYKPVIRNFYKILRRKAGDILYKRHPSYGNYLVTDKLKEVYRLRRVWKQELSEPTILDNIEPGRKYVFFPLHVEPESSLMAESAMADNQLTCLDLLSKSIPADWRIIVKEHPGITARRPKGFWERITRYPNIVKANILESGEELLQKSEVVAIISSTLGFQAAVAGQSVLSFHPDFHARYLPHVRICRSYEETQSAFQYFVSDNLPSQSQRRRHGSAFLAALLRLGVPIHDEGLILGRTLPEPVEWSEVRAIADSFLETFRKIDVTARSDKTLGS